MRRQGPFIMGAQTKNDQAEKAREVMLETLQRFIDQGPSEQELKEAKQNITGGFPMRIAGNNNIVEYLGMIGFYDLPLSYLDDFIGKIEAVTLEDIHDAFKRRLKPENFLVVVLGGDA
jgi:zinc protease